jgi:hypothetical protein
MAAEVGPSCHWRACEGSDSGMWGEAMTGKMLVDWALPQPLLIVACVTGAHNLKCAPPIMGVWEVSRFGP